MRIKVADLIRDNIIDKAYTVILGYELNTLKDLFHVHPNLACRESEIVLGLGLLKTKDMIEYLNPRMDYGIEYSLKREAAELTPLPRLKNLNSMDAVNKLSTYFEKIQMFPYNISETGDLEWAVKEDDYNEITWDSLSMEANKAVNALELKEEGVRTNSFRFLLSNQYNSEFRRFCIDNRLTFDPKSLHNPTVPHMTSCYIIKGILMGASDIYFDPKPNGIHVNYKILNDMIQDDRLLLSEPEIKSFLEEVLVQSGQEGKSRARSEEVIDDVSIPDLGGFDKKYFGRVNLFRNMTKDAICIRVVNRGMKAIPMKDSIVNPKRKTMLCQILMNRQGIFIVAGSTGSGKSTTMSTCSGYMAQERPYDRIESVEDPIEQEVEEISQISLENSNATYDDVAQALTRRNPDIIMLGEMNTPKTIRFGIDAAQQNLMVVSSLHTSSASKIPDRIRSMTVNDPSAFEQFLSELRAILHQSMLKECCPYCTSKVDIGDVRLTEDMHIMLKYYGYYERGNISLTEANPDCKHCEGRGFMIKKPVICVEICPIDDSLREDIKECKPTQIEAILESFMIDNHYTAVQDALEYMENGKLDWMQIWKKFALFQKVSKAKPLINVANVTQVTNRVTE